MAGVSMLKFVLLLAFLFGKISILYLYTNSWFQFISISILVVISMFYAAVNLIVNGMKPSSTSISFVNANIIITGGSSGIGFELAKQAVKEHCRKVILIARNENRLQEAVKEIELLATEKQSVSYLSLDLTKPADFIKNAINELILDIQNIDILINSAGFSTPGEFYGSDIDSFDQMINVNYLSAVKLTHAIIPWMIRKPFGQESGQVVFLSSVGGQLGVYGFSAYSPSKYALRGFAEVLYHELRPYNIGVSLVFPPDTDTPGFENENKSKPNLTKLISEQAGLWTSKEVASVIISGIKDRKFLIGFGSDGYFINALTCGACPASSATEFCIQTFLMPIVKIYMLFLQNYFTNLIDSDFSKR